LAFRRRRRLDQKATRSPTGLAGRFTQEKAQMNKKTRIYFGPPLAILTENESNTMEVSGKLNLTAERYLEIIKRHGVDVTEPERDCLKQICAAGVLAPYEILELAMEVELGKFEIEGLDREALMAKLNVASFADLVALVESLGF
jgi:hypothetical protein